MITQCRACQSDKLDNVISLGDQYLSDFRSDDTKPKKFPIDVLMCKTCSLLQLGETTPPEEMYHDRYGYRSGVNQTMRDHLKGIVQSACEHVKLNKGDVVVDIGSNDATLLKNYPKKVWRVGFDPVSKFKEYYDEPNMLFINDYFNYEAFQHEHAGTKAKVITAISMFYDLEDPNAFIKDLSYILDPEGVLVIQQNYLPEMLRQNAFDNICHEHLEFYSLTSMEKILSKHGLEVVDVEVNDLNGGSFRTYIKHMTNVRKLRLMEQKMKLGNPWTYHLFSMRINGIKNKLKKLVSEKVAEGKKVYVYGASTRGNTLLQFCELDKTLIGAAVERNPEKFGKKISSLGIPIISEEQARLDAPEYMFVLPWFFADEFIKREKSYLEAGGTFIFPLPEPYLVTKDGKTIL